MTHRDRPNAATKLHAAGQCIWLDNINRAVLRTGSLARYIKDYAVSGLTSNPTILGHAMSGGIDYDESIIRITRESIPDPQDLVYAVALEDLAGVAGLFRPLWDLTGGVDGYVSLEVPPGLAYVSEASVNFARRLYDFCSPMRTTSRLPMATSVPWSGAMLRVYRSTYRRWHRYSSPVGTKPPIRCCPGGSTASSGSPWPKRCILRMSP